MWLLHCGSAPTWLNLILCYVRDGVSGIYSVTTLLENAIKKKKKLNSTGIRSLFTFCLVYLSMLGEDRASVCVCISQFGDTAVPGVGLK